MVENDNHTLLIRMDERLQHLESSIENHLKHHWAITLTCAGAAVSALVMFLIKMA